MNIYEEEEIIKQAFSEKYDEKFLNDWKFKNFSKSCTIKCS